MNRYIARELVTFDEKLSIGARLVYSMLDEYAREKGECFPSQKKLVERSGIPKRSLQRYIAELARAGMVEPYRVTPGGANHYRLYHAPTVALPRANRGATLAPPVAPLIRKNTGIEHEGAASLYENPTEWSIPSSLPDPDVCEFCRGAKFVGVGSNRSACGICRGTGQKNARKRA